MRPCNWNSLLFFDWICTYICEQAVVQLQQLQLLEGAANTPEFGSFGCSGSLRFSSSFGFSSSLCLFFGSCPKRLCKVQVARIVRSLSGILTLAAIGHNVSKATHKAISNTAWEE